MSKSNKRKIAILLCFILLMVSVLLYFPSTNKSAQGLQFYWGKSGHENVSGESVEKQELRDFKNSEDPTYNKDSEIQKKQIVANYIDIVRNEVKTMKYPHIFIVGDNDKFYSLEQARSEITQSQSSSTSPSSPSTPSSPTSTQSTIPSQPTQSQTTTQPSHVTIDPANGDELIQVEVSELESFLNSYTPTRDGYHLGCWTMENGNQLLKIGDYLAGETITAYWIED